MVYYEVQIRQNDNNENYSKLCRVPGISHVVPYPEGQSTIYRQVEPSGKFGMWVLRRVEPSSDGLVLFKEINWKHQPYPVGYGTDKDTRNETLRVREESTLEGNTFIIDEKWQPQSPNCLKYVRYSATTTQVVYMIPNYYQCPCKEYSSNGECTKA